MRGVFSHFCAFFDFLAIFARSEWLEILCLCVPFLVFISYLGTLPVWVLHNTAIHFAYQFSVPGALPGTLPERPGDAPRALSGSSRRGLFFAFFRYLFVLFVSICWPHISFVLQDIMWSLYNPYNKLTSGRAGRVPQINPKIPLKTLKGSQRILGRESLESGEPWNK